MTNNTTELLQEGNILRQNNQNYKSFFNTVEDFLLVLDCKGNILHANSSVIDRLGYSEEELYGNNILMLHPSDRKEEAALMIGEMFGGRKMFCPIPVITKSGIQIAVETRISLGVWDGQPAIFGVSKDVSKLRLAEENFLNSLNINPSACGLSDLDDFKYTEVNEAFCVLFGFNKDEVIGRTAMDLCIMTTKARELILQKAGPDGNVSHVETNLKAKNGDNLHVILTSSTVLLQDKKYRFTVVNDITASVKAEELLRNTKIRLHTLLQSIPDLIWVKDAKGVYLSCNTMFERFFGAKEADIIGKTDYDFVSCEVADLFRENDFKAMRARKPSTNEEWVTFSDDGHKAFFETIKAPMYDSIGILVGVLGIGRDITERNTAELALMESEEKFKLIFEGSNDGIILMNKEKFLDCNSRTLEIFRMEDKNQFLGLSPSRFYPPYQPDGKFSTDSADEKIAKAFLHGTNNFDWVFRRSNGEDFPVNIRLSTLMVGGETILQCTIRDISSAEQELIIANKELAFQNLEKEKRASELVLADMELDYQNEEKEKREAANKELEAFSYSVSHDLRAPLRHIGGFVDLLVKNNASQLDVTGLRYLNIISDSSREMGNLIDALLNFSRLSRAELQRTKINSKSLIDKVIKNFGDEIEGRNIDIQRFEIPDLKGDENLITQVWVNLISNALKYSRHTDKTVIEIGGKIEKDKTTFYIKDNGAGFDMKYADKLFGVFQRLHKSRDFEGIGIGLANVNRIIIKHGGKCWAEGEVGVGATFFFNVPNN